jgi:hypothetical protein
VGSIWSREVRFHGCNMLEAPLLTKTFRSDMVPDHAELAIWGIRSGYQWQTQRGMKGDSYVGKLRRGAMEWLSCELCTGTTRCGGRTIDICRRGDWGHMMRWWGVLQFSHLHPSILTFTVARPRPSVPKPPFVPTP